MLVALSPSANLFARVAQGLAHLFARFAQALTHLLQLTTLQPQANFCAARALLLTCRKFAN
jgi:hypothetical protein